MNYLTVQTARPRLQSLDKGPESLPYASGAEAIAAMRDEARRVSQRAKRTWNGSGSGLYGKPRGRILSALKQGRATVKTLSNKLDISRSTVRAVLIALEKEGLAVHVANKPMARSSPAEPQQRATAPA